MTVIYTFLRSLDGRLSSCELCVHSANKTHFEKHFVIYKVTSSSDSWLSFDDTHFKLSQVVSKFAHSAYNELKRTNLILENSKKYYSRYPLGMNSFTFSIEFVYIQSNSK